jgi:hypothetical protein
LQTSGLAKLEVCKNDLLKSGTMAARSGRDDHSSTFEDSAARGHLMRWSIVIERNLLKEQWFAPSSMEFMFLKKACVLHRVIPIDRFPATLASLTNQADQNEQMSDVIKMPPEGHLIPLCPM